MRNPEEAAKALNLNGIPYLGNVLKLVSVYGKIGVGGIAEEFCSFFSGVLGNCTLRPSNGAGDAKRVGRTLMDEILPKSIHYCCHEPTFNKSSVVPLIRTGGSVPVIIGRFNFDAVIGRH